MTRRAACGGFSSSPRFSCTSFAGIGGEIDLVRVVPEASSGGAGAIAAGGLALAAARRRRFARPTLAALGAEH